MPKWGSPHATRRTKLPQKPTRRVVGRQSVVGSRHRDGIRGNGGFGGGDFYHHERAGLPLVQPALQRTTVSGTHLDASAHRSYRLAHAALRARGCRIRHPTGDGHPRPRPASVGTQSLRIAQTHLRQNGVGCRGHVSGLVHGARRSLCASRRRCHA